MVQECECTYFLSEFSKVYCFEKKHCFTCVALADLERLCLVSAGIKLYAVMPALAGFISIYFYLNIWHLILSSFFFKNEQDGSGDLCALIGHTFGCAHWSHLWV